MKRRSLHHSAIEWRRDRLGIGPEERTPAVEILKKAAEATKISFYSLRRGDPLLTGALALLDRESGAIWIDASLAPERRASIIAHEYAHLALHSACCDGDFSEVGFVERDEILGYSPRERRETDADAWAAALLMPEPMLRKAYFEDGMTARRIADVLGLSEAVVTAQMRSVLLRAPRFYLSHTHTQTPVDPMLELDDSQRAAATVDRGPYLLMAGPGTGKTRTLAARCVHLVHSCGVAPHAILALTFSRKAAAEMRERLDEAGVDTASSGPWVGTFHAFCFETLMRYGAKIGLPDGWRLADAGEAERLLAAHLARRVDGSQGRIKPPSVPLASILDAIGRAKDELCDPNCYRERLAAYLNESPAESETEGALRMRDVAEYFSCYQDALQRAKRLDYGDLIVLTVRLLEKCPDVRAQLQHQYPQILADEYQDVNAASVHLLRLLAGPDARGLWLVGDRRQTIYRFRGASPANVAEFEKDYPGGVRGALNTNYRSSPDIVRVFESVAERLSSADPQRFEGWRAGRTAGGVQASVVNAEAETDDAQIAGIARRAQSLSQSGIAFGDQAVLCRTNAQARRMADGLLKAGIPIIATGNILAVEPIKDIVCLVDLFNPNGSRGSLLRAARVLDCARDLPALMRWAENAPSSSKGLARLMTDDDGLRAREPELTSTLSILAREATPVGLINAVLFGELAHLRRIDQRAKTSPQGLAVIMAALRSLADLAMEIQTRYDRDIIGPEHPGAEHGPVLEPFGWFMREIRDQRAAADRSSVPAADYDAFDAVRIMTVHASKGLEFRAVFLPNLSDGQFPARDKERDMLPPSVLLSGERSAESYYDEEACLFFVAISRARDFLCLSRAQRSRDHAGKRAESPLLRLAADGLKRANAVTERWTESVEAQRAAIAAHSSAAPERPSYDISLPALGIYQLCPRRYYYKFVWRFDETDDLSEDARYYRCLSDALKWLEDENRHERHPSSMEIKLQVQKLWRDPARGYAPGLYESQLLTQAVETITQAGDCGACNRRHATQPQTLIARLLRRTALARENIEPGSRRRQDSAAEAISRREFPARPQYVQLCHTCSYRFICPE